VNVVLDALLPDSSCECANLAGNPLPQRRQPVRAYEGASSPLASPAFRSRSSEPLRAFGEGPKTHATLTVMNDTRDLTKRLAELLRREHGALADFLGASSNLGDVLDSEHG